MRAEAKTELEMAKVVSLVKSKLSLVSACLHPVEGVD